MTTAIATCEHITKEQIASEQEIVRHNLARFVNKITNNCETIAQKYQDFVNGEYPDAKPYLIHSAATNLAIMAGQLPEDTPGSAIRVAPAPDANADGEDTPKPKKPTMKELANWDMGRLIRLESDNGRDLILKLWDMTNPPAFFKSSNPDEWKYQKATQIQPHHEFRAMQELSKRGHGSQNPYAYAKTSAAEERRLQEWLSHEIREIDNDGLDIVTYLFEVIRNPKETARGEIITKPYTQSQRLWSIKHLLWRGIDIPWEHITHEDIENYYRERGEVKRKEAERRLSDPRSRLTPEQEADIRAMLDEMQRAADETDRRAAAKFMKKAKKAAKRATAAHDYNNAANANNANNNAAASASKDTGDDANGNNTAGNTNKDNGNNTGNTPASAPAPTGAAATPPIDQDVDPATLPPAARAARALAMAIARHPEVDLDTALENHHATAGIPKENLPDDLIYDAVIAEANFQKRQAIIQSRMRSHDPDAPEDENPPTARSP